MNILFVWTGVTGYMGDAWRALSRVDGVRLKILIQAHRRDATTGFDLASAQAGLDCTLFYEGERLDVERLDEQVRLFMPDVVYIVGWRARLSRHLALCRTLDRVPRVLIFDLPFEWSVKKLVAPVVLRPYLRRFCGCFVPGARAAEYARWLGFRDGRGLGWIEQGLFCANVRKFSGVAQKRRLAGEAPRRFLYVGRYVKEKGIDVLLAAYRRYRALAEERGEPAWGLTCCGMGPFGHLFRGVLGVSDIGFQQPGDLPDIFLRHGAFVLASAHEPWGVVLAEAAAAGLPILCTRACGASLDVVDGNGIVVETGDASALAQGLLAVHSMSDAARAEMGEQGAALAAKFSCEAWSDRVAAMSSRIVGNGGLRRLPADAGAEISF